MVHISPKGFKIQSNSIEANYKKNKKIIMIAMIIFGVLAVGSISLNFSPNISSNILLYSGLSSSGLFVVSAGVMLINYLNYLKKIKKQPTKLKQTQKVNKNELQEKAISNKNKRKQNQSEISAKEKFKNEEELTIDELDKMIKVLNKYLNDGNDENYRNALKELNKSKATKVKFLDQQIAKNMYDKLYVELSKKVVFDGQCYRL